MAHAPTTTRLDRMCDPLPLTGERTVPGIPEENYWFRRHEVVYEALPSWLRGGKPLCWVRILPPCPAFLLPTGVEFLRRALW